MAHIIVQLSDIHFSYEHNNPVCRRIEQICGAIRQVTDPGDTCFIVICGDIANKGKLEEYQIALGLISDLALSIRTHLGNNNSLHVIVVPGNHDLDFGLDSNARNKLLEGTAPDENVDQSILSICLAPQDHFRTFCCDLRARINDVSAAIDVINTEVYDTKSISFVFHLINTPWASIIRENPASLPFPMARLKEAMQDSSPKENIVISVFHHPYYWLREPIKREMQKLLESYCDLILTGHEHDPDSSVKSRGQEKNIYLEGGALQQHGDHGDSSFNVVRIDTENDCHCTSWTFKWKDHAYRNDNSETPHTFLRKRKHYRDNYQTRKAWDDFLDEIGWDFRHPRSIDLRLSHIFCYPDCSVIDIKKGSAPLHTIPGRELVTHLLDKKRIFIAGSEQIGKTCLAKHLFNDLREAGYVPILLNCNLRLKVTSNISPDECIKEEISRMYCQIYGTPDVDLFWQEKTDTRAVIIDDYHRISISTEGRKYLLDWITAHFGIAIIFGDPDIRFKDFLCKGADDQLLWDFHHVDIQGSGKSFRSELIRKWVELGQNRFDREYDEIPAKIAHYERAITSYINNNTLPRLPLFVLLILQRLESPETINDKVGLHGHLYESYIKDRILRVAQKGEDYRLKLNYLTHLAYFIWEKQCKSVTQYEYQEWHNTYNALFNQKLECDNTVKQLIEIGILAVIDDSLVFKSMYYLCFFVAKYIERYLHKSETIDVLVNLCENLHFRDATRVMMFLCHLSHNPVILEKVLGAANKHFKDNSEYDLIKYPSILPEASFRPSRLIINQRTLEHSSSQMREAENEIERSYFEDEDEIAKYEANMLYNNYNAALNIMQLCGQILRNFYGTMEGSDQEIMIKSCISLGMRLLNGVYNSIDETKNEFAVYVAEHLHRKFPRWSDDTLDENTRTWLQNMISLIGIGVIKNVADAIGVRQIRVSLDHLFNMGDSTVSHRIANIAARLEYYHHDDFPRLEITILHLDNGTFGGDILKKLVFYHLHLFPYYKPNEIQAICSLVGIKYTADSSLSTGAPLALEWNGQS